MSPSHLDTGGGGTAGRPTQKDFSNSSSDNENWHSTPASPTMKPADNSDETVPSPTKTFANSKSSPATAFTKEGGVVVDRQGSDKDEQGSRQGSKESKVQSLKPIPPSGPASESGAVSGGDNFSDIALNDSARQSMSLDPSAAASDAEEAARVFATPPQPSTPKMPPLPARPPTARMSTASILASDSGRSFVDGDDSAFDAGPSSASSVTGAGTGKEPAPPLPPRHSSSHSYSQSFAGAPIFPPPPKRRSQRMSGRPMSLASVMSGANGGYGGYASGTASPSSSTASPRSSSFYSHNYLNRPLPQTPTSVVSGGTSSRPTSYSFFSPTTFMSSATATFSGNTSQTRPLSMTMDVPRPLRLQPSLPVRRGTSTPGSSVNGSGSGIPAGITGAGDETDYDMDWLRAHQSAARMARRRQREQTQTPEEYEQYRQRLESHEGTFEVVSYFLQKLAHAENEALEPENFPHSRAEQDRQREAMELMRQETVEALTPLLAYGPTEPVPKAPAPARTASSATSKSAASKKNAVPGHVIGLPPTPPLSPRRNDPRRESGMSSITETSLNGGSHNYNDDASSINSSIGGGRASTDGNGTWRQSMKRASALFGGWGSGTSNAAPASTTRFSGD